jgi:hypothetical protein
VKDFIDKLSGSFPELSLNYPNGQKPQLVLLDENDFEIEVLPITTWNIDTIRDYLNENIKK